MKRAAAALFLAAMAAGLAGALVFTWVLAPIESYESAPDALRIEDKMVYLAIIGDLYTIEGDLSLAEARLAELDIQADGPVLAGLIESHLDSGGRPEAMRNLAHLAQDLGASGGILVVFGPSPEPTPSASPEPGASPTPAPSVTPAPDFRLAEKTAVCAAAGQPSLIAVWVQDAEGNGLAGVEIVVSWATGEDRFLTGLRPEQGVGYADFEMSPRVEYDVALADYGGEVARGLTADLAPGLCPTGTVGLDWRVTFQQIP
ncbi:MAG: hypothetical protein P8189_21830 [Anaerolineae bacterium]|jgi:hypothetical protein